MAFIQAGNTSASDSMTQVRADNRRSLRRWLGLVVLVVAILVLVGGATRLTHSGLSITEWKPLHGVIPPLTESDWQQEFELYKAIPQYKLQNAGMTIAEFKDIYWWEWVHRALARLAGAVFALPFFYFLLRGRIEKGLGWPLFGILLLGGLQGVIGWWMVSSGLVNRVDVSQYRLATHLVTGCLLFGSSIWVMRSLAPHTEWPEEGAPRVMAGILAGFALFQIYLGALVAGLHAGLSYNTWPLMDGALVPGDLFLQQPWWINLFDNPKTVQFVHRLGAYVLFALAIGHAIQCRRTLAGTTHSRRAYLLALLVVLQASLGIATLLTEVHLHVALAHQAGALVVFGFAVAHWRGFFGERAAG